MTRIYPNFFYVTGFDRLDSGNWSDEYALRESDLHRIRWSKYKLVDDSDGEPFITVRIDHLKELLYFCDANDVFQISFGKTCVIRLNPDKS